MDLKAHLDTFARLSRLVDLASEADSELITRQARFDELAIDSLSMIELVVNIEEEFHVRLDDTIVRDWSTLSDAVAYLEEHSPQRDTSTAKN